MLPTVFKDGVDKGLVDYVGAAFSVLIGDTLTASDDAAKKKAVAKFKKAIEGAKESYDAAVVIVE
ncbi:MAG: hypothetical protein HQ518_29605 [Rhodopirellula sp.]|nr:hypothetical protein [Rhodopirellula sp.]